MLLGRDREIQEIVENCGADRLTVITARPGLGLTALLREGVAPALQAAGALPVLFSEWQGRSFSSALKEAIADVVRERADDLFFIEELWTLADVAQAVRERTGRRIALLFDRFEDYLRCHSGSDLSDTFDAELARMIAGRRGCVAIGLHEEALPQFQRLAQHVPNLLGCRLTLGPLDSETAGELIRLTAAQLGIEIQPVVAELLLQAPAAQADGGIHPFFLLAGVNRLLEGAKDRRLTAVGRATLDVYGGADRVILESLDPKIATLSSDHVELLFRWGKILISAEGQRVAVKEQALMEYSGKLNRFAASLLPRLLELRILRTVELADGIRYEIARESLTPMVRSWWKRRETDLIAKRKANFRVRSLSVALGSILTLYVIWLLLTIRK